MSEGLGSLRIWLVLLIAVVLFTGGFSSSEHSLNASHNGSLQELARGQDLVITLESNPSTGYRWQVIDVDEDILHQVGEAEYHVPDAKTSVLPGASGTETFRFDAVEAGTTNLMLVYWRPWEKGVQPLRVFITQVTVR